MKSSCCKKYKRKGKACGGCPTMAMLGKKGAKELLKKHRK